MAFLRKRISEYPNDTTIGQQIAEHEAMAAVERALRSKFYPHRDACARCRDKPLDLCGEGLRLTFAAAMTLLSEAGSSDR